MARYKTFAGSGTLTATDLNTIQDIYESSFIPWEPIYQTACTWAAIGVGATYGLDDIFIQLPEDAVSLQPLQDMDENNFSETTKYIDLSKFQVESMNTIFRLVTVVTSNVVSASLTTPTFNLGLYSITTNNGTIAIETNGSLISGSSINASAIGNLDFVPDTYTSSNFTLTSSGYYTIAGKITATIASEGSYSVNVASRLEVANV